MSRGVCVRALKLHHFGKASRGKPRRKPESGNPTFRACRGARENVTSSFMTRCARLGSIPTKSGSVSGSGCNSPGQLGVMLGPNSTRQPAMEEPTSEAKPPEAPGHWRAVWLYSGSRMS